VAGDAHLAWACEDHAANTSADQRRSWQSRACRGRRKAAPESRAAGSATVPSLRFTWNAPWREPTVAAAAATRARRSCAGPCSVYIPAGFEKRESWVQLRFEETVRSEEGSGVRRERRWVGRMRDKRCALHFRMKRRFQIFGIVDYFFRISQ
jgi:hypothetical protein